MAEQGGADDVKESESNKAVDPVKWLRDKGFTEADSISLVEFGVGPPMTASIINACLNNEEMKITKGGRRLLAKLLPPVGNPGARVSKGQIMPEEVANDSQDSEGIGGQSKSNDEQLNNQNNLELSPQKPAPQDAKNLPPQPTIGCQAPIPQRRIEPPHQPHHESDHRPQTREHQPDNLRTFNEGGGAGGGDDENFEDEEGVQNTLDDLMEVTGATYEHLHKECADSHTLKIAQHFTSVYSLGSCLKLREIEIAEISRRQGGLLFQLNEVLVRWKKKYGHKATYLWLVEMSLEAFADAKTAQFICKLSTEDVFEDPEDQGISDNLRVHRGFFCSRKVFLLCIVGLIVLVLLVSTGAISFPWLQGKQGARPFDKAAAPPPTHTFPQAPPTHPPQVPPTHTTQAPPPPKHAPHTGPLTGTIIRKSDRPKMPQLRNFKLRTGKAIDIVTEIGMDYTIFGQLLLESQNEVKIHEASCQYQPKCIVDRVLGDWLVGKGQLPVTWERLVSTLDEADLSTLAHDIRGQYTNRDEL